MPQHRSCRHPCPRCEGVPAPLPETGRLLLWLPLAHSLGKVRQALPEGCVFDILTEDCLSIQLQGDGAQVIKTLGAVLSPQEQADILALVLDNQDDPTVGDIGRTTRFSTLLGRVESPWLVDMIADNRLETHFQPIVTVPEATLYAHECLLRGRDTDGALVPAGRLFGAATAADLLFQLDRAARVTAVTRAAEAGTDGRLFINFAPNALYDPSFCLRTTLAAMEKVAYTPDRVVFEVVETERITDLAHLKYILGAYREMGFGIALDDLGSGYASLTLLTELKPDIVKLDMDLIRNVHDSPVKAAIARHLLSAAREMGITTLAEGVETAAEWAWIRGEGADLAQGYYFGRPQPRPTA